MNINRYITTSLTDIEQEKTWDICQLLTEQNFCNMNYAMIVLNRPVTQNPDFMIKMWNNANIRITVDGGTKQWDRYINQLSEEQQQSLKLPEFVTGDFDSITEEILEKYKNKGCKSPLPPSPDLDSLDVVIHTPDQNYTDFTKAIMQLNQYCIKNDVEVDTVMVVGQTSGRMDQIMGNIQTLFLCEEKNLLPSKSRVVLMSDNSLSWLLFPGHHTINVPEDVRKNKKPWCSMVPIGQKCESVTTTGLKWNLEKGSLMFGDLVSTSNTYCGSPVVTIACSHTILWSMKVPSFIGQ